MATSGTYSFTVTRDDIIRMSMLQIGKLGENENPTAQETVDCSFMLNMMTKQWMGKQDFAPGLKMWTRRHSNLFLSATTGTYNLGPSGSNWTATSYQTTLTANSTALDTTLTVASIANASSGNYIGIQLDSGDLFWTTINGAPAGSTITITTGLTSAAASGNIVYFYSTKAQRPLAIETAVLRDVNSNDTPLNFMTLQDYDHLPSKANTDSVNDPTAVYYEAQLTNGVLYLDTAAVADPTKYIHISYLEPIQDFNAALDNPEFPQGWYMALVWGLAKLIAPMFNVPWTQDMQANASDAIAMAKEADSEITSMYFEPGNDGTLWYR